MYAWDAAMALHPEVKMLTEHPPNSSTIVQPPFDEGGYLHRIALHWQNGYAMAEDNAQFCVDSQCSGSIQLHMIALAGCAHTTPLGQQPSAKCVTYLIVF